MAPSKMQSECRLLAAESFKCMEKHTKEAAKDACAPFFENYKACVKEEKNAASKAQKEGPRRSFF